MYPGHENNKRIVASIIDYPGINLALKIRNYLYNY